MKTRFFIFTILVSINFQLYAWDVTGHRVIAEIAYKNLNKNARKKVDKLIGEKGIIFESSWPDLIRSDKKYSYSYPWHYQNLRDSMTNEDIKNLFEHPQLEGDHLFYAIDLMIKRLKTNPNDEEALKFLVHFVGDLFQPMHLGRADDLGGNKVAVKWFGENINLHSLWDSFLIDRQKLSYTEISEMLILQNKEKKNEFSSFSLLESIFRVYVLRNEVYSTDLNVKGNYMYAYIFTPQLNEMLYFSGIQLAKILNEIYG